MRKLHVKRVLGSVINRAWCLNGYAFNPIKIYYIRCNKWGIVNWDKAPVFHADELIGRDKVIVHQGVE